MAQITHWHILGAGSLGCLWAYYLKKAGHTVTLIAKDKQHQTQLQSALPLTLVISGKRHNCNLDIISPDNGAPIQHLLICLKAYQTPKGLESIKHAVTESATLVLIQNGMGNQQFLLDNFPYQAIYSAITTEAACRSGTLVIEHTGTGMTQLGNLSATQDMQLLDKLSCDLKTTQHQNIEAALWQKLVINCCINPLTVIHQCKNGALADNAQAQQSISNIITECKLVATSIGKQDYLTDITRHVENVIHSTANNTSSMRQDILNNQMTEIDYMNGYIINLAKKNNISTPENTSILKAIKGYL